MHGRVVCGRVPLLRPRCRWGRAGRAVQRRRCVPSAHDHGPGDGSLDLLFRPMNFLRPAPCFLIQPDLLKRFGLRCGSPASTDNRRGRGADGDGLRCGSPASTDNRRPAPTRDRPSASSPRPGWAWSTGGSTTAAAKQFEYSLAGPTLLLLILPTLLLLILTTPTPFTLS